MYTLIGLWNKNIFIFILPSVDSGPVPKAHGHIVYLRIHSLIIDLFTIVGPNTRVAGMYWIFRDLLYFIPAHPGHSPGDIIYSYIYILCPGILYIPKYTRTTKTKGFGGHRWMVL